MGTGTWLSQAIWAFNQVKEGPPDFLTLVHKIANTTSSWAEARQLLRVDPLAHWHSRDICADGPRGAITTLFAAQASLLPLEGWTEEETSLSLMHLLSDEVNEEEQITDALRTLSLLNCQQAARQLQNHSGRRYSLVVQEHSNPAITFWPQGVAW